MFCLKTLVICERIQNTKQELEILSDWKKDYLGFFQSEGEVNFAQQGKMGEVKQFRETTSP